MRKPVDAFESVSEEDWTVLYDYQHIAGVPEMIQRYEQQELQAREVRDLLVQEKVSQKEVASVSHTVVAFLRRAHVPEDIIAVASLYADLAEKMRKQGLRYLDLPPILADLARASWYQDALCWGRGFYYDGLHEYDEASDRLVRVPDPYTREEIRESVLAFLSLDDPRVAVSVPLSWRVGVAVGWLSGLAVSQGEDVQAAMVMMAALVTPLFHNVPARGASRISGPSSQKALSSGKSRKSSRRSKSGRK